jgi:multidrug resistance efflux pump
VAEWIEDPRQRLAAALGLLAVALDADGFRPAATGFATELATRLALERVAVGFARGGEIRVEAISHNAHFDPRTRFVCDLSAAMAEAVDQDAPLRCPAPTEASAFVIRAHESLRQRHGTGWLVTLPLVSEGHAVGAVTLEARDAAGLPDAVVGFVADLLALAGPVLALQRARDAGFLERSRELLRRRLAAFSTAERTRFKLAGAVLAMLLLVLLALPGEHRVKADARLEGRVQRAIVAGLDGYVAEATARAGDVVRAGQLLGRLDERDLELERRRWRARREQLHKEYREALVAHERAEATLRRARLDEADAQLALLDEQILRTRFVAPFDGIVVDGDLSQSLGSPVTKGEVVFQVASLDGYRLLLDVDERDIAHVRPGHAGRIALAALPGSPLPVRVDRVTPVASAAEGRTFFRVEASLQDSPASLRPGMEGVAKIDVGRRQRFWIWTRPLVDWLRLQLWSWWP